VKTTEPNSLDMLMARHAHKKVDHIVEQTYGAFRKAIAEYRTLSADELFAIGIHLVMNCCIAPLEKMSKNPQRMRNEMGRQFRDMIQRGTQETN
jgi:hypothetical protein